MSNPFVLSANFHSGAVVVNYPFDSSESHRDGVYSVAPDDETFKFLAKTYADNHKTMATNVKCSRFDDFPEGITNGAQWYDIKGGMQVWIEEFVAIITSSSLSRISTISTPTAWS